VKGASVVAFDPATGKAHWKSGDDEVSYSSPVLGKLGDEELAVFFTRDGLLALKPKTGEIKHQYPWRPRINASVNAATPIVSGGRVYVSTSYSTGAVVLEVKKGRLEEVAIIFVHAASPKLLAGGQVPRSQVAIRAEREDTSIGDQRCRSRAVVEIEVVPVARSIRGLPRRLAGLCLQALDDLIVADAMKEDEPFASDRRAGPTCADIAFPHDRRPLLRPASE
jgi:hypothetical protein